MNTLRSRLMMSVAQERPARIYYIKMPLTQDDTSDNISGSDNWFNLNRSWNSNIGAWQFTQSDVSRNKLRGVHLPWNNIQDLDCVIEFDAYLVSAGYRYTCPSGWGSSSPYCEAGLYFTTTKTDGYGYIPLGQWVHCMAVRTPGGNIRHYTDGEFVGEAVQGSSTWDANNLVLSPAGHRWGSDNGFVICLKNFEVWAHNESLPYNSRVEYIESDGTQYLSTDMSWEYDPLIAHTYRWEVDGKFTDVSKNTQYQYIGSTKRFYFGVRDGKWRAFDNSHTKSADTDRHLFAIQMERSVNNWILTFYIDQVKQFHVTSTQAGDTVWGQTFGLFGQHTSATTFSELCKFRMYSAVCYKDGEPIRRYLPVRANQNTGTLYEEMVGTFPSESPSLFKIGPDL